MDDSIKKWFRKSKIVRPDNRPLIMYHGTENDFEAFDRTKIGISSGNLGFLGKGFYFTKDLWRARAYGDVIYAYLRIEAPFIINGSLDEDTANIISEVSDTYAFEEGMDYTAVYNGFSHSVPEYPEIAESITSGLQYYGYDGIIYGDFQEVVCFEPKQIFIIKKEAR